MSEEIFPNEDVLGELTNLLNDFAAEHDLTTDQLFAYAGLSLYTLTFTASVISDEQGVLSMIQEIKTTFSETESGEEEELYIDGGGKSDVDEENDSGQEL